MHKLSISDDVENMEVFSSSYIKDSEYNIEDEENPSDNGIAHKEKDHNHFLTQNVTKVPSPHESKDSKEHKSFQFTTSHDQTKSMLSQASPRDNVNLADGKHFLSSIQDADTVHHTLHSSNNSQELLSTKYASKEVLCKNVATQDNDVSTCEVNYCCNHFQDI